MEVRQKQPKFHRFCDLPKELRDKIWDLAIQHRTSDAQAHFFRVYDRIKYDERLRTASYWTTEELKAPKQLGRKYYSLHLGPPSWGHEERNDVRLWNTRQNPSAYLCDDVGLWHACPESRRAVLRCWRQEDERNGITTTQSLGERAERNPLDAVSKHSKYQTWILSRGREQVRIVTRKECDLFLFQLGAPGQSARKRSVKQILGDIVHSDVKHIGFEYSTQWPRDLSMLFDLNVGLYRYRRSFSVHDEIQSPARTDTSLGRLGQELWELQRSGFKGTVWFVDNRLKPHRGRTYADLVKDRHVFLACGRRYVEVHEHDFADKWRVPRAELRQTTGNGLKAYPGWPFRLLGLLGFFLYDNFVEESDLDDDEDPPVQIGDNFKVLACLFDSDMRDLQQAVQRPTRPGVQNL